MTAGAVSWDKDRQLGTFEYEPDFLQHGLDLAPIHMPIERARAGETIFSFPTLPRSTFMGLPGLLADALPDRFGNAVIDSWLARQGRISQDFSPVERLCYIGKRATGALEFSPVLNAALDKSVPVEINELLNLAQIVTDERAGLITNLNSNDTDAMLNIIRVGTSAGGNCPKAVIALNDETKEVRSGQVAAPEGFDYWVLKFDGIQDNSLGDPAGYGRIEYAYYKMAVESGIAMTECRLLEENTRAHFMTKRFDRPGRNQKLHMESLCALAHFDFNNPGAYSYEQAFQIIRELKLSYNAVEQQFRRMVFNVVARNQDDHTKNIAFLMEKNGRWHLSPAFDVTYSFNPGGMWTNSHQMTIKGKRDNFTKQDMVEVGAEQSLKQSSVIIDEVVEVVSNWPSYAKEAGVQADQIKAISKTHRLLT
jgi:serine/threonine-protein kinase HipA